MKAVTIYTDGSCLGNPGPGGWAAVLICGEHTLEVYGSVAHTTNNRMELQAAIEALGKLKAPCQVTLISDSTYLLGGLEKRMNWTQGQWQRSQVPNSDLWLTLAETAKPHEVVCQWVRGHETDEHNVRADQLAHDCASIMKAQLQDKVA